MTTLYLLGRRVLYHDDPFLIIFGGLLQNRKMAQAGKELVSVEVTTCYVQESVFSFRLKFSPRQRARSALWLLA